MKRQRKFHEVVDHYPSYLVDANSNKLNQKTSDVPNILKDGQSKNHSKLCTKSTNKQELHFGKKRNEPFPSAPRITYFFRENCPKPKVAEWLEQVIVGTMFFRIIQCPWVIVLKEKRQL
ncbi:hypothetical protein AVEN_109176-1 [Araneus ventricosus]|uniref:Uncharacterized protein n=1 Tax=Araneus ventricosus TaxID=182803 RepID=A0A4Y2L3Q2_ARAVE|nr:hypothetical protein AVEN_109176-1 [Araneus ventricosus]